MSTANDQELFREVKKGHQPAFERLFKHYYASLARYASSITRDITVGEEIAQEVFLYIWDKKNQIELHTGFKSYIFSSAKNKCLNYLKLELPKHQATTDLDHVQIGNMPLMGRDETDLLKKKIQAAIDVLPEKCRNIFVLSRYGGLTYKEIAEELDISVKTVENQMTIALRKLKEQLSEDLKNYRIK
jgi:RNA polymerase sigma-70 factor (ECF subfamily)